MNRELDQKIAIVTGLSRGLGQGIALALAEAGADLFGVSTKGATETKEKVEALGRRYAEISVDLTDPSAPEQVVEACMESYGRVDILVNNAGITRDNLILMMKEQEFDEVIDTNLKGAFNMIRHVSGTMLRKKYGRIINVTSVSGMMGNAGQANYAAAKAGMIGLTKTTAKELASRGITCNAVAPGFIETEMTDAMPESAKEAVKSQIPLQRVGNTADIAEAVAFLASDRAAYITGQVISVDGGMHM